MTHSKKILCSILSTLLMTIIFFPTQVSAQSTVNTANSSHATAEPPSFMSTDMKLGEKKIIGQDENGMLYVEVTKDTTNLARYTTSPASKDFTFYHKNWLGVKKDVFKVTLECTWTTSKISNLKGTYTILDSKASCSWDTNYNSATDTLHTMCLDYVYGSISNSVFFSASIITGSLDLSCSSDYGI